MTPNFSIVVQKFGGSSVANTENIMQVAQFIKNSLANNQRICVVVSAMGHTTNDLITLAHRITKNPNKRELDMLISCGERSSMALLAIALLNIGVKAMSLTGSQSGIITDDTHNGAEIIEIRPSRVIEAFLAHQVVIIAGFQGVSLNKEITTLKRGGSDTTAVAMAASLNATACEIYSDVAGVMDIDPNIYPHAKLLPTLNHHQMEALALYGARIVALDAIRLAREQKVSLVVAKSQSRDTCTMITADAPKKNDHTVLALTHLRGIIKIALAPDKIHSIKNQGSYFLCGSRHHDHFIGYVSNDLTQELKDENLAVEKRLALITIHLTKNEFAFAVLAQLSKTFAAKNIVLKDLIVGRHEIFVVVDDDNLNEALSISYQALGL